MVQSYCMRRNSRMTLMTVRDIDRERCGKKMLIQRFFKGCGKGMDIHPVVFSLYYIKPREKPLFVLDVL